VNITAINKQNKRWSANKQ